MAKTVEKTVIGKNLQWLGQRTGISVRSAGMRAGLSESATKHMVAGRSQSPRHENLQAVAKIYGITAADLASEVLTTNYDKLIESAASRADELYSIKISKDIEEGRNLDGAQTPGEGEIAHKSQEFYLLTIWQKIPPNKRGLALAILESLQENVPEVR